MCSPLIHSLWHNKNFKIFLSHTKLLSLCVVGPQVMGKTYKNFSLSLSLSLQNLLCNLPSQRKVVSTQLQTGYNGSQQLTTGPNGLKRVPSQRVPTGSNGGRGGEERSMTRLLSPHNYIIYIIYPKKFYFSIHISSLSLSNNPRKYLYIKKKIYSYSFMFIYLFI